MTASKRGPDGAALIPLDLANEQQVAILKAQRIVCGCANTDQNIKSWRSHIEANDRAMFWIALEASTPAAAGAIPKAGLDFITTTDSPVAKADRYLVVGHIALDKKDYVNDDMVAAEDTLTSPDGSRLMIATLFILPEFKALRLGTYAMDRLEILARDPHYGSAKCTTLTLATMSERHAKGGVPGPEGYGIWAGLGGLEIPERTNVGWFERLGYVGYKEAARYFAVPGRETPDVWCTFMEKRLGPLV